MNERAVRTTTLVAGISWIAAAAVWLIGEAVAASAFPGYDYATNYISDLGIPDVGPYQGRSIDSPLHLVMTVTFVAQGMLFALGAAMVARLFAGARRTFVGLAIVHALGLVLVAAIPSSPANQESGIIVFHVVGAAMAIVGGNLALIVAGASTARAGFPRVVRVVGVALGAIGLFSLGMLMVNSGTGTEVIFADGVWERGAVYTVTAWELLVGVLLVRRAARRNAVVAT
jgi:hypothetical membrane protein